MRTKILLTIAATATILAGCSNEETNEAIDNWNGEIRLSSGIAVQTRTNASDQGQQIASGQTVGVFINSKGSGTPSVAANLKYNANGSGTLALNTSPSQTTPFYPSDGSNVKIVAYQPYDANATNAFTATSGSGDTYNFTVKTDQTGNSNKDYYDSDLLYAKIEDASRKANAHELVFEHKLSKVICTLIKGDGIGDSEFANATVSIVAPKITGTFKPSDGTFTTTSETSNTTNVKLNDAIITDPSKNYIGIIPPQSFTAETKFLEVEINGGKFYYKAPSPSGITLAEKTAYKYNITVKATGLTVTSSITPWTDGSSGGASTGDATMDEPTTGSEGADGNP